MKKDYSIIITPDNIEECVNKINLTILESIKCNRELYGSTDCQINSGALSIFVTSAEWDVGNAGEYDLNLYNGESKVGFILIDEGMFVKFSVSGVEIHQDGFVDYQCALIEFEDWNNE